MTFAWDDSRRAFGDAADAFVALVHDIGDRWQEPGLGEWDVRALTGHTSRSFLTVEAYLAEPAAAVDVETPAGYFRACRAFAGGPEVTERGRQAGLALGEDPTGAVVELAGRVRALVAERGGSELVTTVAGGMRLRDYLPTRTFELAVHGTDLAVALGVPFEPPATAAAQALRILSDLAVEDGRAAPLLRAATGRPLPAGFTLL